MCPDLIREFEDLERLKKKQRAKKLEQQAELARRKKLEAEQRDRSVKDFFASRFSQDSGVGHIFDSNNVCEVIDMCSSGSSSSEEYFSVMRAGQALNVRYKVRCFAPKPPAVYDRERKLVEDPPCILEVLFGP
ncbi:hypothetical protein Y032_0013g2121 [Ancylostoma ceylanicum]|nr:hypothetical protein Y032_0013g2121 [Ancylostoma ceylanicum]